MTTIDGPRSAARPHPTRVRVTLVAAVAMVATVTGCGSSDAVTGDTSAAPTAGTRSSAGTNGTSRTDPAVVTTSDNLYMAQVTSSFDIGADWRFIADGETHLWLSGPGGQVARVDPDTGAMDEIDFGDVAIAGDLLPTVIGRSVWLVELGGTRLIPVDTNTLEVGPAVEVAPPVGLLVVGDGRSWIEMSEPPAGLRPFDPGTGATAEPIMIEGAGEIVGSRAAFGSLWVPRYEGNEVLRVDLDGTVVARYPSGVGPADVVDIDDALWWSNRLEGTLSRLDPETGDVETIDLNGTGPPVSSPGRPLMAAGAVWAAAGTVENATALLFRIDPTTLDVVGPRALPGLPTRAELGGIATLGDRLFVVDRAAGQLLEIDTAEFLTTPDPSTAVAPQAETPDESAVRTMIEELFAATGSPRTMAALIENGDQLEAAIASFTTFFEENAPGETIGGDVVHVSVDGDQADVTYAVTVSGSPLIDPQTGTARRIDDGTWVLARQSFCDLVALGGRYTCPAA